MGEDPPKDGEVIPPEGTEDDGLGEGVPHILALIKHYTNRPDLFLAEVERHDPGFIKRMNASAAAHSKQLQDGKFKFGERQAYTSLSVQVFAALVLLSLACYLVVSGNADFGTIMAITIFFAVTQSGVSGFLRIASALSDTLTRHRKKDE